jgi:NAD(P)-dependent dehydrogenase (short-subunit alcohol dehydrogenase family)
MTEAIKTSLVTGGTRGIGSEIADVLRNRGDEVITVSRGKLDDKNHISTDLSSKKQINEMSKRIKTKYIDNMIFCHRYRGNKWRKEFQISLDAVHYIIENLRKNLTSNTSIVIIGSNASRFIANEQSLAYHTTRAALESLTQYYAVHLGDQGARCNCVLVGGTLIKPENAEFFTKKNLVKELIEDIRPLKKMGDAKDVAYLVEFLCSDKASFITGQSIFVDGGLSVVSQESLARKLKNLQHSNDANKKLKAK